MNGTNSPWATWAMLRFYAATRKNQFNVLNKLLARTGVKKSEIEKDMKISECREKLAVCAALWLGGGRDVRHVQVQSGFFMSHIKSISCILPSSTNNSCPQSALKNTRRLAVLKTKTKGCRIHFMSTIICRTTYFQSTNSTRVCFLILDTPTLLSQRKQQHLVRTGGERRKQETCDCVWNSAHRQLADVPRVPLMWNDRRSAGVNGHETLCAV